MCDVWLPLCVHLVNATCLQELLVYQKDVVTVKEVPFLKNMDADECIHVRGVNIMYNI